MGFALAEIEVPDVSELLRARLMETGSRGGPTEPERRGASVGVRDKVGEFRGGVPLRLFKSVDVGSKGEA